MIDAGLLTPSPTPAAGEVPPPPCASSLDVGAPGPSDRVPRAPGRPPLYFRDSDCGLPGRPLTEFINFRTPGTFIFPRAVAPYAVIFLMLALVARTGAHGTDCAAISVKELEKLLPFSDRWIYRGLNFLAFHGFLFSTPAPPSLVAQGCHRVFRLRVPKPGTVAATPPQARVSSPDRVFDPPSQPWGGRRRPVRPDATCAPIRPAPDAAVPEPAAGPPLVPDDGDVAPAPAGAPRTDPVPRAADLPSAAGPAADARPAAAAAPTPAPHRRAIRASRDRLTLDPLGVNPYGPSAKEIAAGVPEGEDNDPAFMDRFSDYVVAALVDEFGPVPRVLALARVNLPQAPGMKTPPGPYTLERSTDFYPRASFREDIELAALHVRNRRVNYVRMPRRVFGDDRPESSAVFDVAGYNKANGTVTVVANSTRLAALPHHVAYGNCLHAPAPLCKCFGRRRAKLPPSYSPAVRERLIRAGDDVEKHFL